MKLRLALVAVASVGAALRAGIGLPQLLLVIAAALFAGFVASTLFRNN